MQKNRPSIMLMIVMKEITAGDELGRLWSRQDEISRNLDGLGSPLEEGFAALSAELDSVWAQIDTIHETFGLEARNEPLRKFYIRRLGHGVAHPDRVVGIWADGALSSEASAPLPEDEVLEDLISSALGEYEAEVLLERDVLRFEAPPNRAFTG